MESAQSHSLLAKALADSFTVCVPDRREHTLGFPFSPDYSIQKEVEDLEALLSETASHSVFGVSSGGVICLKATLSLPGIDKAVVYEPPLSLPKVEADAALKRYDSEMAEGRVAAALITAMRATQMGPRAMRAMPRWLLERMVNMQVRRQESQAKTGGASMRTMAGTLSLRLFSGRGDERETRRVQGREGRRAVVGGQREPGLPEGRLGLFGENTAASQADRVLRPRPWRLKRPQPLQQEGQSRAGRQGGSEVSCPVLGLAGSQ